MTALQLNAQIYRELAVIAEDESLLDKALKALRRITAKKADPTAMSREEFERMLEESEAQIRRGEGRTFHDAATMNAWLKEL